MIISSWNINSVRLRIAQVLRFLKEQQPDVLCLQETKTQDVYFPAKEIADAGFSYQAIRGEKSYNGVAILSRLPIENIGYQDWVGMVNVNESDIGIVGFLRSQSPQGFLDGRMWDKGL